MSFPTGHNRTQSVCFWNTRWLRLIRLGSFNMAFENIVTEKNTRKQHHHRSYITMPHCLQHYVLNKISVIFYCNLCFPRGSRCFPKFEGPRIPTNMMSWQIPGNFHVWIHVSAQGFKIYHKILSEYVRPHLGVHCGWILSTGPHCVSPIFQMADSCLPF